MPITKAGTRITVEFQGGDPKGDSWNDPFNLDDIVAASVAGGWNPAVTKQGIQYLIPYSLYIIGADTYFLAENSQVYFEYVARVDTYVLWVYQCNFRSWGTEHGMSWLIEQEYGKTGIYVIPTYGHIENTKFTRGRTVNFGGSISNNLIIKKTIFETCDLIALAANNYVEVENITIIGSGGGGISQAYDFVSAENITIIDASTGIYVWLLQELNVRKLKMIDVANHIKFRPSYTGQILNCFDSLIDLSSYTSFVIGTGDITANNISTFKINIADGDGGTAKLYDKDDNLIFSELLSGELEKDVIFEMMEFDSVGGVKTKELLTTYEPFKLVITKSGYMDLIIPSIAITAGDITQIFGKMVVPIYYQQAIDASVSEEAVSGAVETVEVTGTINT